MPATLAAANARPSVRHHSVRPKHLRPPNHARQNFQRPRRQPVGAKSVRASASMAITIREKKSAISRPLAGALSAPLPRKLARDLYWFHPPATRPNTATQGTLARRLLPL